MLCSFFVNLFSPHVLSQVFIAISLIFKKASNYLLLILSNVLFALVTVSSLEV